MIMRTLLLIFTLLFAAGSLCAQEPEVRAAFNPTSAEVGETVQFVIEVDGNQADRVPEFKVDGLEIRYAGASQRFEFRQEGRNMSRNRVISYEFEVTPRRAGNFMVPPVAIQVGGQRVVTTPVSLRVRAPGKPAGSTERSARADIILPKPTAYIGETLVTELRLSVDEEFNARVESMPILEAEAFTKTKPGDAKTTSIIRSDRKFSVLSVHTGLTPTKAGKLTVGPAVFQYVAEVPRPRGNARARSWFDPFFMNPMNDFRQLQRVTTASDIVELNVKPLPVAGRPANFSGAVGQFKLEARGTPARIRMGDPITMTVTVSGTGNFDRVTAPVLTEADGWRAYPPSATYKGEDSTGVSGKKNFEIAVIPEEKKDAMPVYEFSYFDPEAEKYVTLKTDRLPLSVEGDAPRVATPDSRGPITLAAPAATPPPPKPTDIMGLRYDTGPTSAAQPVYSQRAFLLAQLVPFGFLCGMIAVRFWPRDRQSRAASALQRERAGLLVRLRQERTRSGFFAAAARLLHIDAALRRERGAGIVELATADEAPIVREILESHAQADFSGGAERAGEPLLDEDRKRVLEALLPLLNRP